MGVARNDFLEPLEDTLHKLLKFPDEAEGVELLDKSGWLFEEFDSGDNLFLLERGVGPSHIFANEEEQFFIFGVVSMVFIQGSSKSVDIPCQISMLVEHWRVTWSKIVYIN